ncbi:sensor histidine kinase [Thalassovita sp.]|uniref:sensor histidine kinase n=1 Tax=Thalassovita sp. TaxID=1979401 RepID=UPI003B59CCE4
MHLRETAPKRDGDVVLGDEFVAPDSTVEKEIRARRARRGFLTLNRSPLTRKIITFNLIALNVLVAGVLLLNSSRDSLVVDRVNALTSQAELVADVVEAQLPKGAPASLASGDGIDVLDTLNGLDLRRGVEVYVFSVSGELIAAGQGKGVAMSRNSDDGGSTLISDALATAAELGGARDRRNTAAGRIRIPDLTARPDEIGRLSSALRGMVSALYDRIDSNEQFAADVAHEIKNPLASLRSAVGTLRVAQREDQREKLLDVIDHDVRRLDRLVSDISNASRLDSELVKEEQESFNLLKMVGNLGEYLGQQAEEKGIEFIMDIPDGPITIHGLEARLAQVFVNLITNAISFCEDGDAIRVWVRQRDNRVLVVVEDTGPGIPEQALTKVFKRFYSERPENQFGNNSGLGLAISKQIIEAHGGVIWAENIRPTEADPTSEPLGARFVVGLPV